MAALQTKTIYSDTTSNGFTLKLKLTENSVSTASNDSDVDWELILTSGVWNFSTYHVGWDVRLAGKQVSYCSKENSPQISLAKNSSVTIAKGKATVAHNADGSLDMTATASTDMASASYTPGPMSLSGSMKLTKINRGLLYIDNGSKLEAYQVFIDNGSSWEQYVPYIDNGSGWDMCN